MRRASLFLSNLESLPSATKGEGQREKTGHLALEKPTDVGVDSIDVVADHHNFGRRLHLHAHIRFLSRSHRDPSTYSQSLKHLGGGKHNALADAAAEMNEEYSFATKGVEKGRSTWIAKEHLKLKMKSSSGIW
jgi:hypothetical protein